MNKHLTELVFILDRSGSMSGLESDTIGGYNGLLEKQKKETGEAVITTVLFDDRYELLHDRIPITGVEKISHKEYFVRGTTALLDAIGKTISKIDNVHEHTKKSERAGQVMFVITTDGLENASREYSADQVRKLIERKKKAGWEFIFLGANIDAVETARSFGISEDRAVNYHADAEGTLLNYAVVNETVSQLRSGNSIDKDWKSQIEEDFKKRKN
ncbi:MAG: hypothetical protein PWP16_1580 [Eubacteriaceae bacterium]|jgi:uncharacterized protein YegL|nr:hypothetical protein [Eubacteriaceae bacterium]